MGRFTGELAKTAAHVTAVEFMPTFIKENEAINGAKFSNITFLCADATTLDFPNESFDFVFTNWLMMYFTDAEVQRLRTCSIDHPSPAGLAELAEKSLKWLTPQGQIFFRESCRKQSGDAKRKSNPTKYREPEQYTEAFESVFYASSDDHIYRFDLVQTRPIQAYIVLKVFHCRPADARVTPAEQPEPDQLAVREG